MFPVMRARRISSLFIPVSYTHLDVYKRQIDTYETSILPYEDCCTIFVAKHPVTKPNINRIKKSEERRNDVIDELMKTAIDTTEVIMVDAE